MVVKTAMFIVNDDQKNFLPGRAVEESLVNLVDQRLSCPKICGRMIVVGVTQAANTRKIGINPGNSRQIARRRVAKKIIFKGKHPTKREKLIGMASAVISVGKPQGG